MSVRSVWSIVLFKSTVPLFSVWMFHPLLKVGQLKSPTIIVLLSISPFSFVSVCLVCLGALMLGAYIFISVVSSW